MIVPTNSLSLQVEENGNPGHPAVLLIAGVGMQLTNWPPSFVEGLVSAGYRVLRFDNRDIGLSSHLDHLGAPRLPLAMVRQRVGLPVRTGYTITDMANDSLGLLDALGIERAHVVGVSMGGMIAQRMCLAAPRRIISLTSIMSSSGARGLPGPRPDVGWAMATRPINSDKTALVEHGMRILQLIGSPDHQEPAHLLRRRVADNLARSHHPVGASRQMLAVIADTHRADELHHISTPTLVIHGQRDPLVPLRCGEDTAQRIPGARLLAVPGMGHDLPDALVPVLLDAMCAHFASAPKRKAGGRQPRVR